MSGPRVYAEQISEQKYFRGRVLTIG